MPGFDKTGPKGQGAMTGRKRGRCANNQTTQTEKTTEQSTENKDVAYGLGRGGKPRGGGSGKGGGRGRGRRLGGN